MQITQALKNTEYWINFRQECAAYIEKHLKDAVIPIELPAIVQKKKELVFTLPNKEQYKPVYNVDAEFILEERASISFYEQASIFADETAISYEWAAAIIGIRLRNKPFSMSIVQWDNINNTLNLLCENKCLILKNIIKHNWMLGEIFGCHEKKPEKVHPLKGLLMLMNDGDQITELSNYFIKILNKRDEVQNYSKPYLGYHVRQILIHDLP